MPLGYIVVYIAKLTNSENWNLDCFHVSSRKLLCYPVCLSFLYSIINFFSVAFLWNCHILDKHTLKWYFLIEFVLVNFGNISPKLVIYLSVLFTTYKTNTFVFVSKRLDPHAKSRIRFESSSSLNDTALIMTNE